MENKNIWLLPTDKPSRLYCYKSIELYLHPTIVDANVSNLHCKNYNIYITSDEEIKEGDYGLIGNDIGKIILTEDGYEFLIGIGVSYTYGDLHSLKKVCKKIILTDNEDLIQDGVQEIDDDFLEWFVKNPSCEWVEVDFKYEKCIPILNDNGHKILIIKIPSHSENLGQILQKEEPKQSYEYVGECKGNDGSGCFLDSCGHDCGCFTRKTKQETPNELESVLAKISHINDLGKSEWYEVVYYDNKWCSYSGSKTFEDGEKVIDWKYCKGIFKNK